jgi:colanic acid biosynthesis glycosyl transferase WcaI
MRVLFLGINYWPEQTGIAPFNTGRCEYLAALGHDVTMCTALPYYPEWRVPAAYRRRPFAVEERNGVRILRCPLYVPARVTPARRILHEASFVVSSCLRSLATRPPDVLMTVSPPLALGLAARLLGRFWRVPFLLHVPDLQPDAAADLGMLPPGRLLRVLYAVERGNYRAAACVSTLTEGMRERIVAKGCPPAKVAVLPDWADPSLFDVPATGGGAAFRREHGIGDRFLAVHCGNMGVKQGLDVILGAAERADPGRTLYLLVGDGAVRPALQSAARARGIAAVRFLPLQPRAAFLELLAAADVALVTQQRTVADVVFPSKVLTLLAAARPVIASVAATSEVARVVTRAAAGSVVAPEDPATLDAAVAALAADSAQRAAMGQRGREYARRTWERGRVLGDMAARIAAVVAAHRSRRTVALSQVSLSADEGGS